MTNTTAAKPTAFQSKTARDMANLLANGQPVEDFYASISTALEYRLITVGQAKALARLDRAQLTFRRGR